MNAGQHNNSSRQGSVTEVLSDVSRNWCACYSFRLWVSGVGYKQSFNRKAYLPDRV